jgi:hypothetical protein
LLYYCRRHRFVVMLLGGCGCLYAGMYVTPILVPLGDGLGMSTTG